MVRGGAERHDPDEVARPDALGRAQQPPGGEPVEFLDRRARLIAGAARQVHDDVDAAQRVAPARRVREIADGKLHADALGAEPAWVADQATDRRAACGKTADHGVAQDSGGTCQQKHSLNQPMRR